MKRIYATMALCMATLASTTVFATNNGSDNDFVEMAGDSVRTRTADTTRFHFGKREVIFDGNEIHFIKDRFYTDDIDESGDYTEYNWCWGNEVRGFHSHVEGVDLGVSGYGSDILSANVDDSARYMELYGTRSIHVALNLTSVTVPIVKDHFAFCPGFGLKWDCYNFCSENLVLGKVDGHLQHSFDTTMTYDKSKLRVFSLTVPLMFEWQPGSSWNSFFVMAGVEGNFHAGTRTKMVASSGDKYKSKHDICVNTFSYDAIVRMGWNDFGFFAKANLSPLFKDGKGPELYPYSVGVSFCF